MTKAKPATLTEFIDQLSENIIHISAYKSAGGAKLGFKLRDFPRNEWADIEGRIERHAKHPDGEAVWVLQAIYDGGKRGPMFMLPTCKAPGAATDSAIGSLPAGEGLLAVMMKSQSDASAAMMAAMATMVQAVTANKQDRDDPIDRLVALRTADLLTEGGGGLKDFEKALALGAKMAGADDALVEAVKGGTEVVKEGMRAWAIAKQAEAPAMPADAAAAPPAPSVNLAAAVASLAWAIDNLEPDQALSMLMKTLGVADDGVREWIRENGEALNKAINANDEVRQRLEERDDWRQGFTAAVMLRMGMQAPTDDEGGGEALSPDEVQDPKEAVQ